MMAISDFKYAIRLLSKKPGFTFLTTLVMATGIGLSLFLFSIFNTMIFKSLPFEDGASLVKIAGSEDGLRGFGSSLNLHDYYEIRTSLKGISEFSAYREENFNVSGRDGVRRYSGIFAEPNIFQLTRTKPILGRVFTELENQVGADNVAVIGFDLWQNLFAGDSKVIDQRLRVSGVSHRVIGVMPQGYFFPSTAEIWVPMRQDATKLNRGDGETVYGLAHIAENSSSEEVNRQLDVIMQRIEERYPKTNNGIGAFADSLQMSSAADSIVMVYAMQFIAVLILVLASVNVGNLLFSRAIERKKEIAIRVALGAPRSRLISQMLWESIIICSLGGLVGLAALSWGLEMTQTLTASFFMGKLPFWWNFTIDIFTITLLILFVLITIFVTGFLPAWKNSGADFNEALRDGTRGALGRKAGRLNRILVASEIFLSITVTIAVGVLVMGSYVDHGVDYGANTDNILTATVRLPESNYDSPEKQIQFFTTLQSHLETKENLGKVTMFSALPGGGSRSPTIAIEGIEYTEKGGYPRANYIVLTSGSLFNLGVEIKEGRYFSNSDDGLDKSTVIVTDSFVSRHFPKESPIGKRIRIVDGDEIEWLRIVGVVEHTYQGSASSESGKKPSIFRPYSQAPRKQLTVALEMKSELSSAIGTLRNTIKSIDPELPAYYVEPYTDRLARVTAPSNFISGILLLFGFAAIVYAASGIYGVMSNTIVQRTQEIGVKRALGADEERITKEFLLSGFKQFLWGGIPGGIVGCAMGFAMSKGIGIEDTAVIVIAVTVISIIGGIVLLATYVPTSRTLRMEPSDALHHE
jgi:putative ABC transport system permease protein